MKNVSSSYSTKAFSLPEIVIHYETHYKQRNCFPLPVPPSMDTQSRGRHSAGVSPTGAGVVGVLTHALFITGGGSGPRKSHVFSFFFSNVFKNCILCDSVPVFTKQSGRKSSRNKILGEGIFSGHDPDFPTQNSVASRWG